MIPNIPFSFIGAWFGALAVALGAFAAHGLKKVLSQESMQIFEVGVRYQMYHALALLFLGILSEGILDQRPLWAGASFVFGIVLFSGSLYLLTLTGQKSWGMVTPIGGVLFIIGWSTLAWICMSKTM